ncbi:guanylate kinase [bacterium]|nr:guanylate kinase [bacterium]
MEKTKSKLFVISAPSGTGKTTIIKSSKLLLPELTLSISHTTRLPRKGEKESVDYFFVSKEEFKKMIDNQEFIEWAEVHGNFYGTSKKHIDSSVNNGKIVVLDIDVQGAMQIKKLQDRQAVFIFFNPPSIEELARRLESRGTETEESLKKRINNAKNELAFKDQYDYIITNDDLEKAVKEFLETIKKEIDG